MSYAAGLRRELLGLNGVRARGMAHGRTWGSAPAIVYAGDGRGHGNFYEASYRAIVADEGWAKRLEKVHTQGRRMRAVREHEWKELDTAVSSDALLMNVFCDPKTMRREQVQRMLGLEGEVRPVFGWKPRVPLKSGRFDAMEADMLLGELMVEAKLTESGFQSARLGLVERYVDLEEVFDLDELPRVKERVVELEDEFVVKKPMVKIAHYQLVRGILAAHATGKSYAVICDVRRPDLLEAWFGVVRAVQSWELRTRVKVLTWQELAAALGGGMQAFLRDKYGIAAGVGGGVTG